MSNLSDLIPAGASGKTIEAVASGTLGSGVTVSLKADGTVTAVAESVDGAGTAVVFENANSDYISATYDSANNKIVIAYRDNDNLTYGTAIVGTVSGTSISFGTAVVFNSANSVSIASTYDSTSGKVVIAYRDIGNSSSGTAIVGTVSGTAISFGTAVVFKSATAQFFSPTYDSTNNKVVIPFQDSTNLSYGTAVVGTVSGTSISFGTVVVFESAGIQYTSTIFDSNSNKIVIAYQDNGNAGYGTAIVGTVSGTSISFGTAVVFENANTTYIAAAYDSANNKVVIAYMDVSNSYYGTAIVGTVSGTSISFGTAVVFESARSEYNSATYDSTSGKVVIAYRDVGNFSYGTAIIGTVSGTSISFGTAIVFENANTVYIAAAYDSANSKVVIAYEDIDNSSYGTSVVFTVGSSNSASFIGITDAAISSAATGTVVVQGGTATGLSSLTAGSKYYVQDDGTLTTVSSSVNAGLAISATSLLLNGDS